MKHVISDDQIDRAVAAKCRLYGFSKWDLPGGLVQVYRREAAAMLEAAINGSEREQPQRERGKGNLLPLSGEDIDPL